MKKAIKRISILVISLVAILIIFTECSTKIRGSGKSESIGEVNNGSLKNGRKFPFRGENYRYFSRFSYGILNRAWVHEKVLKSSLEAYSECKKQFSNQKYLLMECSPKNGGRMWPHRTHQNGTSIDFDTPLLKNGKPFFNDHYYGLWHYSMKFDENGISKRNKNVKIDFEMMSKHILILNEKAKLNGLKIRKVIFKIDLKDNLFESSIGKKLLKSGIYFAQSLPKIIDEQHDEHYHIDFEEI